MLVLWKLEEDPSSNALVGHSLEMTFGQFTFEGTNGTFAIKAIPVTKFHALGSLRFCDLFQKLFSVCFKLTQPLLHSGIQEV